MGFEGGFHSLKCSSQSAWIWNNICVIFFILLFDRSNQQKLMFDRLACLFLYPGMKGYVVGHSPLVLVLLGHLVLILIKCCLIFGNISILEINNTGHNGCLHNMILRSISYVFLRCCSMMGVQDIGRWGVCLQACQWLVQPSSGSAAQVSSSLIAAAAWSD